MIPINKDATPRSSLEEQACHYRIQVEVAQEEIDTLKLRLERLENDKQWLEMAAVRFESEADKLSCEVVA